MRRTGAASARRPRSGKGEGGGGSVLLAAQCAAPKGGGEMPSLFWPRVAPRSSCSSPANPRCGSRRRRGRAETSRETTRARRGVGCWPANDFARIRIRARLRCLCARERNAPRLDRAVGQSRSLARGLCQGLGAGGQRGCPWRRGGSHQRAGRRTCTVLDVLCMFLGCECVCVG